MQKWWEKNCAPCELGDRRLNKRAGEIGQLLSLGFGQALSAVLPEANGWKRGYEFLPIRRLNLAS